MSVRHVVVRFLDTNSIRVCVPGLITHICEQVGPTMLSMKQIRIGIVLLAGLPEGWRRYLVAHERFQERPGKEQWLCIGFFASEAAGNGRRCSRIVETALIRLGKPLISLPGFPECPASFPQ